MRALCDAVVVGAGTVAADDPQLTTRHVAGPSPVRVVLDPTRRLADHYRVFTDESADTLYVCGKSFAGEGETHVGRATLVAVDESASGIDVGEVLRLLHARGCHRNHICRRNGNRSLGRSFNHSPFPFDLPIGSHNNRLLSAPMTRELTVAVCGTVSRRILGGMHP